MKTAFLKSALREIKTSFGRFISIALMLLIGTFAFVGIKSAGPDMRYTLDEFTNETNMSHMMVQFTTGIEEKDKEKILEYEEISDFEFLKAIELKTKIDDKLINLISLPEKISRPRVLEGKYPENQGEILLDNALKDEVNIGDKIQFKHEEETLKFILDDVKTNDTNIKEEKELRLKTYEYEVVGFCIVPEYLGELDKGKSFSRYGDFYSFGYIAQNNFNILKDDKENNKTQIAYLRFKNLDNMKVSDLGFEARSIRHKEFLEKEFKNRPNELFNEMNNNILDELAISEDEIYNAKKDIKKAEDDIVKAKAKILEGWIEYREGLEEYNDKIYDAKIEINQAKEKIENAENEYNEGKSELDKAKNLYNEGLKQYNKGYELYNQSKAQLDDAEIQLNLLKQNKDKLLNLKTLVANEISLKKIIDKYDLLFLNRTNKIREKNEALASGNTELAAEIQIEIDEINAEITALGDINAIKSQYNAIQTTKASFDNYQRGIYQLEYNAILAGHQSYIQNLIDSIPSKENEINQGRLELSASKVVLDNTKKELDIAKAEIDSGEKILDESKNLLDKAKKELEEAEQQFDAEKNKGFYDLIDAENDLNEAEDKLKAEEAKFNKEKTKAEKEILDAESAINKVKENIKKLDKPLCIFSTRYDNTNYYLFYDSANKIDILANVFPPFLFLIALMVSLTTMTRMVDEQRQEIGTYKGLGYLNKEIVLKYVIYGGLAAILGGLLGVLLGADVLAEVTFNAYATTFVLKERLHVVNYGSGIMAMILAIASTSFAAYLAVNKYLNKNAATLMRPRAQRKGKKTIFEKINFIWKKLPFLVKVTLRNVFRYKGRMFMTILGVGGCTGLLFFGFSLRNSMAQVLPKQTKEVTQIEYIVSYNELIDEDNVNKFEDFVALDERIEKSSSVYAEPLQYKSSKGQLSHLLLIVPKDEESFREQINLIDSRSDREKIKDISSKRKDLRENEKNRLKELRKQGKKDIITFNNKSVIFTDKFLKITGKEIGEHIFIQNLYGQEYKVIVGTPTKNYISHFAYMTPEYYDAVFDKATEPNTYLITLKEGVDAEQFKEDVFEYTIITSLLDMRFEEVNNWVLTIDVVVLIVLLISGILAFVVLYNLTYINLSERIREISTIKVLGFYSYEVVRYIYSETAILTALGIFAGYYIGNSLYTLIADLIIQDTLNLYQGNNIYLYLTASAITIFFFAIVGIIINKKLKKIDMVEALKGFE